MKGERRPFDAVERRGWPCAERSHRTHTQEFYEGTTAALTVAALATQLLAWETVYNTVRPHQALAQLTPLEYLTTHFTQEAV
jgi:transposase InsO family protein